MDVRPDDLMGRVGGPGDSAFDLRGRNPVRQHRKRLDWIVSGLHFHGGPIDGRAIEARRRSGLETAQHKAGALKRPRQAHGWRFPDPARRPICLAEVDQTAQKGPCGHNHRADSELTSIGQANPLIRPFESRSSSASPSITVRLAYRGFQPASPLHRACGRFGRGVRAPPDLPAIQNPELDAAAIRDPAHQAVQGIDLADQMTLAKTTNGRIAGHGTNGRKLVSHQRGFRALACGCCRGLTAGMASPITMTSNVCMGALLSLWCES
jgi:hypothetical protein